MWMERQRNSYPSEFGCSVCHSFIEELRTVLSPESFAKLESKINLSGQKKDKMCRGSHKQALEKDEKRQIREYFNCKKDGVFVEVGANEPVGLNSQSWHLEKELNWSGLLIEPNPELAQKAKGTRPKSIICECACTSPEKAGHLTLYIPVKDGNLITSHAAVGKNIDDNHYRKHLEIKVEAKTLNELLESTHIEHMDFLSIDVEGAEMDVLLGLSLDKYRPKLILLEDKHNCLPPRGPQKRLHRSSLLFFYKFFRISCYYGIIVVILAQLYNIIANLFIGDQNNNSRLFLIRIQCKTAFRISKKPNSRGGSITWQ